MDRDTQLMQSRLLELSGIAEKQNRTVFSRFLSLADISLLSSLKAKLPGRFSLWGGHEFCERKMAAFGDDSENAIFPIVCLHVFPKNRRYAQDLSHRDFLGSLIGLGITRDVLGDLFVSDSEAYCFVSSDIASFIETVLVKVSRTDVHVEAVTQIPQDVLPKLVPSHINIASTRLDALIAAVYHLSRSNASSLFVQKKVFVDAACTENASYTVQPGQIISVRGFGRFRFNGIDKTTKKGRLQATVSLYVS